MPLTRYEAEGASIFRRKRDLEKAIESARAAKVKVKAPSPSDWVKEKRVTPAVIRQLVKIAGDKNIDPHTRAKANVRLLQIGQYDNG